MIAGASSPEKTAASAKGYYSLVQYCPDLSRAEAANVGVLLFCPDKHFIDVRTTASNQHVARFFGRDSFDPERLRTLKRFIEDRVRLYHQHFKTMDDLNRFIESRANDIIISQPRPVKVFNPETDLQKLYEELVGGKARTPNNRRHFLQGIDDTFNVPALKEKLQRDVEVELPSIGSKLHYRYAFNNGRQNLIRPTLFPANEQKLANVAFRLGGEGVQLDKHLDKQLIVICGFEDSKTGDSSA
ncbi:MAG TPA: DUF3037 domain-containing protein, partial [Verrucomicrobiae bacterium]|nr:DUF3037 domain-containing protein [Verrucomicrobiae bacterium]